MIKMEDDVLPNDYLLEEVGGTPIEGIPMTEGLAIRLTEYWDPKINKLIEDMELEKVRRELYKQWEMNQFKNI